MNGLAEIFCAFSYHCGKDNHLDEEKHEEQEKAMSEPSGRQLSWRHFLTRQSQSIPYLQEELSSSTIVVAISFSATEYRHNQWNQKADDSELCEHDVEKTESEISGRYKPHVVAPFFIFLFCHTSQI